MPSAPAPMLRFDGHPGVVLAPGRLGRAAQEALVATLREAQKIAPFFTPEMPKTGKPFSVRMTNLGPLGWVSDRTGYRYQPTHPATGAPWPPIPDSVMAIWEQFSGYPHPPEACLVNFYSPDAKLGLHQDRDEADFDAPIVSISLGDTAKFRIGGVGRGDPTRSFDLKSGDVLAFGGPSRLMFHGVDRIIPGTSTLLGTPGRINLTLRRVTKPG